MSVLDTELQAEGLTSTEPIMAWRAWTLSGRREGLRLRLLPIAGGRRPWPPLRPALATCKRLRRHRAPGLACSCGLHATRTPDLLRRTRDPAVIGSVALWGRVIEHELGYRAEFAYPQRLRLVCYLCFCQWGAGPARCEAVARVGRGRMVPLCAPHVEMSNRYGVRTPHVLPAREVEQELLSTYAVDLLHV